MRFERKEREVCEEKLPGRENSVWFKEFFVQRLPELKWSSVSSPLESGCCCLFQTYYLNIRCLMAQRLETSPSQKQSNGFKTIRSLLSKQIHVADFMCALQYLEFRPTKGVCGGSLFYCWSSLKFPVHCDDAKANF